MSKKREITGYYVLVEPNLSYVYGTPEEKLELAKRICEGMVEDINRHVDDVGWVAVLSEADDVCEYCGRAWTEDSNDFNGGCCDRDMKHEPPTEGRE